MLLNALNIKKEYGIQTVLDLAQPNDVVCVCGSLYMIGEARHALGLC